MTAEPADDDVRPSRDIADLIRIMARLRDPERGCSWDLEQSFATIAPYTIEEAYEVADAVARGDLDDLRDELGDLLLQVVFQARLAEEQDAFAFGDVVEAITAKLIRRHPHVFGEARSLSPEAVKALWDQIKRAERAEKAARGQVPAARSALDGVPPALPALSRSDKLARKAAAVGFAWPDLRPVLAKVEEELAELRQAVEAGGRAEIEDEFGDLLFTVANLGQYLRADPEATLAAANRKFERRFRGMETKLVEGGRSLDQFGLTEMDEAWASVKRDEREALSRSSRPPESA
ncbi:nucleoside triphosphate pyrophosphohydrolase [uncultured Enterovirga sp.]|uniref:nucleoside triphosphate pyrophosphohydrolase n=1 Tax=uncultured Enterovirga sp. TaxID=2026352 RepID=UPI0035C96695